MRPSTRTVPTAVVVALILVPGGGPNGGPDGVASASPRSCTKSSGCRPRTATRWGRPRVRGYRGKSAFSSGPKLFAPDSIWNARVPAWAPLDPASGRLTAALASFIEAQIRTPSWLNGGYPNIGADKYSTPIYRVGRRVQRVPVRLHGNGSPTLRRILARGVPIPDGAAPAVGTDGHMTVYQPATDTLWEFWRARKTSEGWEAAWAGAMRNASQSPGYYTSRAWSTTLRFPEGWNWGSTATSLPVAGGTVTLSELRRGRIEHALAMALPNACRDLFSWPAQRSDGENISRDCIPEGARFRIDPAVDLDALGLHPVARMLAEAAQRYGMVVRDQTRVSAQFFLESPPPGRRSPYTGPGGLYGAAAPWEVLHGFPWRRLQLLPMRLCSRAPCHAR